MVRMTDNTNDSRRDDSGGRDGLDGRLSPRSGHGDARRCCGRSRRHDSGSGRKGRSSDGSDGGGGGDNGNGRNGGRSSDGGNDRDCSSGRNGSDYCVGTDSPSAPASTRVLCVLGDALETEIDCLGRIGRETHLASIPVVRCASTLGASADSTARTESEVRILAEANNANLFFPSASTQKKVALPLLRSLLHAATIISYDSDQHYKKKHLKIATASNLAQRSRKTSAVLPGVEVMRIRHCITRSTI